MEDLLCVFLECGSLDLSILEDVGYDLGEIVEELQFEGIKPTLNAITDMIFLKGQREIAEKLEELIALMEEELEDAEEDSEEYEDLENALSELEDLNPEEDIDWFCNCLDTSIWFSDNEEIYRKYLEDVIEDVENDMGFSF